MWYRICFWLCVVIFSVQGWSPTQRLPRHILPSSYSLKITPNVTDETFHGDVTIIIQVDKSVPNVTLNSRELLIHEITLDQAYKLTGFELNSQDELLYVFHSNGDLIDPGEHILNIKYNGYLNSSAGFYAVKWRADGVDRVMLTTKFSPTYARKAFPCFDEPYFKSLFNLRLVNPNSSWIVLSNMEEILKFNSSKGFVTDFRTTLPMSTYLLTWFFTDLNSEEIEHSGILGNIPLRIFTPEDRRNDRMRILRTTSKALTFFEDFTGLPFTLQKLDSVAVPSYRSGGMEHWGAITYHVNSITYDKNSLISPLFHSIGSDVLIAHEVSHMWLGNLVTHAWYNDLWLTEGFARFMQYKAAYSILGEPFVTKLFLNHKSISLYQSHCDGLSLETVSFPRNGLDIRMKYGPSTYDQGAAVLFMLEDVIGSEMIQQIIRNFLHQYKYKHSTTGNFINCVQEAVPMINLRNMMETFLFQKKLPSISVTENEEFYILKQKPFCSYTDESIFRDKWTIPIKYFTSTNHTSQLIWFDRDISEVVIPKRKDDKWIKISHLNHGLFRSVYTENIYDELLKNFTELSNDEIGSLLEETFLMAYNESIPCRIPLLYLAELRKKNDLDFITFTYASRSLSLFMRMMPLESDVKKILHTYFIHIFEDSYRKVGWTVNKKETMDERLLRMAILESFCMSSINYVGCSEDVEKMSELKIKPDEDIQYIFKTVLRDISDNSSKNNTSILPTEYPSTDDMQFSEYEKTCTSWIRQNIPEFIGQFNHVLQK